MRTDIQILLIGLGGALGAISRFGIAQLARRLFSESGPWFPLGTLVANLLGCFLIGVLIGSGHADKSDPIRVGVGIGFLGALTTFSTFSAETISQFHHGSVWMAIANILANVVLGILCVGIGIVAGKKIFN